MKRFLVVISIFYIFTRFWNWNILAPFHDEVIYIWLSKQFATSPLQNWSIGFIDGKEPLFFWIMGLFQAVIPEPLLAGRVMSAVLGLIGLGIFYKLASKLLTPRGVMIATLSYVVSPFLLLHQRLALIEGLLTTLLIFAFYRLICFLQKPSLGSAIILGVSFALPAVTKTNSWLFMLALLPLGLYYFKNIRWSLVGVAIIVTAFLSGWLYLLPQYKLITEKNKVFAISLPELLNNPLILFKSYIRLTTSWIISYLGLGQLLCLGLVIFLKRKQQFLALLLLFAAGAPVVAEMFIAKQFFARYFLFSLIPFLLVSALCLQQIRKKLILAIVLFIIFLPQIVMSKEIIFHPTVSSLHPTEQWQFIYSWPAGYGWEEASSYIKANQPDKVVIEDIWGALYSLRYYNPDASYDLITHNYHADLALESQQFIATSSGEKTVFVFTQQQDIPTSWSLTKIATFFRPGGVESISIWQYQNPEKN